MCVVNYRQYMQLRSSEVVTVVTNLSTSCIRYNIRFCTLSVRSVCVKSPICNVPSVNLCTCFECNLVEHALDVQLLRIFTHFSRLQNVFPCSRNLPLDTVLSQLNSVHILTPSFISCLLPSGFPFYFKVCMCATYPTQPIQFDLVTLISFGDEDELWILSVCCYISAHLAYCV
jgi:hypothetical protein